MHTYIPRNICFTQHRWYSGIYMHWLMSTNEQDSLSLTPTLWNTTLVYSNGKLNNKGDYIITAGETEAIFTWCRWLLVRCWRIAWVLWRLPHVNS